MFHDSRGLRKIKQFMQIKGIKVHLFVSVSSVYMWLKDGPNCHMLIITWLEYHLLKLALISTGEIYNTRVREESFVEPATKDQFA